MEMKPELIDHIVSIIAKNFRTFGNPGDENSRNPIAAAMAGTAPTFASGVNVRDVVQRVAAEFLLSISMQEELQKALHDMYMKGVEDGCQLAATRFQEISNKK